MRLLQILYNNPTKCFLFHFFILFPCVPRSDGFFSLSNKAILLICIIITVCVVRVRFWNVIIKTGSAKNRISFFSCAYETFALIIICASRFKLNIKFKSSPVCYCFDLNGQAFINLLLISLFITACIMKGVVLNSSQKGGALVFFYSNLWA